MAQTYYSISALNLALNLPLYMSHNECEFFMLPEVYRYFDTSQKVFNACRLALMGALHHGLDPTQIYIRSQIHNTTLKNKVQVLDNWHVTASIKTNLHGSNVHQTMHIYTDSENGSMVTYTTSGYLKSDSSLTFGKSKARAAWPTEDALIEVPINETPDYMVVRWYMIEDSNRQADFRQLAALGYLPYTFPQAEITPVY